MDKSAVVGKGSVVAGPGEKSDSRHEQESRLDNVIKLNDRAYQYRITGLANTKQGNWMHKVHVSARIEDISAFLQLWRISEPLAHW